MFRQGGLLSKLLPVAGEVLLRSPAAERGSLGFTEQGCVMAAWSREPSGVLKACEVSALPSFRVPVGAVHEQLMGGGAAEPRELLGGKKPERGAAPVRVGPRGVSGSGASPAAAAGVLALCAALPACCRVSRPGKGLGRWVAPASMGRCLL